MGGMSEEAKYPLHSVPRLLELCHEVVRRYYDEHGIMGPLANLISDLDVGATTIEVCLGFADDPPAVFTEAPGSSILDAHTGEAGATWKRRD